jgi:hypothetical protein
MSRYFADLVPSASIYVHTMYIKRRRTGSRSDITLVERVSPEKSVDWVDIGDIRDIETTICFSNSPNTGKASHSHRSVIGRYMADCGSYRVGAGVWKRFNGSFGSGLTVDNDNVVTTTSSLAMAFFTQLTK